MKWFFEGTGTSTGTGASLFKKEYYEIVSTRH
jgi:hypothetical protein